MFCCLYELFWEMHLLFWKCYGWFEKCAKATLISHLKLEWKFELCLLTVKWFAYFASHAISNIKTFRQGIINSVVAYVPVRTWKYLLIERERKTMDTDTFSNKIISLQLTGYIFQVNIWSLHNKSDNTM